MAKAGIASLPVPLDLEPMEAKLVSALPTAGDWQFEPKWDGFRCLAFRAGAEVELRAKSGKPLQRYFPEMVAYLRELGPERFVVDGELAIPRGGVLSFDALQDRIHPAPSRIRKLAHETPAILILFDCLSPDGAADLRGTALNQRRVALERFVGTAGHPALRLTPMTRGIGEAEAWIARAGGSLDGVVAKRADGPYRAGERAMLKVKHLRTADCVVGGFRYATGTREVGSLLLGLHDADGRLDHVGFTSTIPRAERPALTARLEQLIEPPGFTGDAPGGPSRWSNARSADWQPLRPELVVEVRYDHVSGDRFRHGTTLLRWRPDKAPRQCTMAQLEAEAGPSSLYRQMMGARAGSAGR